MTSKRRRRRDEGCFKKPFLLLEKRKRENTDLQNSRRRFIFEAPKANEAPKASETLNDPFKDTNYILRQKDVDIAVLKREIELLKRNEDMYRKQIQLLHLELQKNIASIDHVYYVDAF